MLTLPVGTQRYALYLFKNIAFRLRRDVVLQQQSFYESLKVEFIQILCRNIEKRFGDAAGKISIAATIFKLSNVDTQDIEQQQEHVRVLAKFFRLQEEEAVTEWVCFRNYLMKHQKQTASLDCVRERSDDTKIYNLAYEIDLCVEEW